MKGNRLALFFSGLQLLVATAFAQTGILKTERSPTSVVTFTENAAFLGLSNSHFIDGYVKRDGTGRFIFPVGHGSKAAPFAGDGGGIIGAYFAESPDAATIAGGPFPTGSKAGEVQAVSTREYWQIDGANSTTLTFTWNSESALSLLTGSALNKLSVIGWSVVNKRWEKIPSQVDGVSLLGGSSTLSTGSISTSRPLVPNNYEVYTLGALTTSTTPPDYVGKLEVADCRTISGWVYDRNNSDSELMVELLEGTTVHAQIPANIYRGDLRSQGIGTGSYGFSMPLPEQFRDGNYRNFSIRVRGTDFVLDGSPKIVGCGYRGNFESADCNSIKGWAVIGEYPDSTLIVDLLVDGQLQGSYFANQSRLDIQPLVGGRGNVGFEFPLPGSIRTNTPKQISVRAKNSTFVLEGSPKTVNCVPSQYRGGVDATGGWSCDAVKGWVWDQSYPNNALTVELVEGGTVLASAVANAYRADVKAAGFGSGNSGFTIPIPASLKDGRAHQLSVRVKGSTVALSSQTLTCVSELYEGKLEVVDCSVVKGWVWDKSHPESGFTVELLDGSTVIASGASTINRPDLQSAGYGTGNYGFSISLPSSLKDGITHNISVRIKGVNYTLEGSPKSIMCPIPSQYRGGVDATGGWSCDAVKGWVWDQSYPNNTLTVELVEGGTVLASAVANAYRADVKAAGFGSGNSGFTIPIPASLKDGRAHQLSVRVKGSTVALSSQTLTCVSELYEGKLEVVDCSVVKGWVWDKSHPESGFTVELLDGSTVIASGASTINRPDLQSAGYGTGNYGFSISLPSSLKDGITHNISVRIKGVNYTLEGSPKSIMCPIPSQYRGGVDATGGWSCDAVKGWVWDQSYPNNALTVELVEGGTVLASAVANAYRADVKAAGFGSGNSGFTIPIPASLKDGRAHQLSVRVKGSTVALSSQTLTCVSELYEGKLEVVDCSVVKGWVWDKSHPESGFTVELLDGSTVIASGASTINRPDLQSAGYGTGNYGFSISLPSSLKDGITHNISVRIKGVNYTLEGSPKSIMCPIPSQYRGGVDATGGWSCDAVKGWVWDQSYPNNALTVELVEGGTVLASAVANAYRADVKAAGFGSGNSGFTIPIPASLKDGRAHQLSVRVKGSTVALSSQTLTCVSELYEGKLEVVDCSVVKGWVWDKSHPESGFTVELLDGSTVIASGASTINRPDLQSAGYGTGNYGFSISLPSSLKDGITHNISVRIKGVNYTLEGSPKSIMCPIPSQYRGGVDATGGWSCDAVKGWVWDQSYPNNALTVELVEGGTVLASAVANAYRADVKAAGFGSGNSGFTIPIPASLKDGRAHQLSVRVKGSTVALSSQTLTCVSELYEGKLEVVDCSVVKGWVWDKSHPESGFTVELLDGSTVIASGASTINRPDLQSAGYGTGNYGFSISLPSSLKDGITHNISVRIKGVNYTLEGSPKSIMCPIPSQYRGGVDATGGWSCDAVKGWVWDQSYPNNALTVELVEGGTVLASAVANAYRADVKAAGFGSGNSGFTIPIPASLKDGRAHQLSVRVKGSTVALSSQTLTCVSELYEGKLEVVDCSVVKGWVWDKSHPESGFTVELLDGSTVIASGASTINRPDLQSAGYGTGNYGFSISLPSSLKDGITHNISVRIKGVNYTLEGSPKSIMCPIPSQYRGGVDATGGWSCDAVKGWVWDQSYPNNALTVELVEGGTVLASAVANAYRADVKAAGFGSGNSGFTIPIPASLKDGRAHQLSVRVKGSTVALSSQTLTCVSELYEGKLEVVDCSVVKGWVWDKSHPESGFTVELLDGSTVIASGASTINRPDLQSAGYGTGNYGFSISLPSSLKDGITHNISVRIKGVNYTLEGSPKSIMCPIPSQYRGGVDATGGWSCDAVKGWVWDQSYPNNALTVELVEGGTVLASAVANAYRADVKAAGFGSGNSGFTIPIPASLKDGRAHQLSVRVKGSTVALSSQTLTCVSELYEGKLEVVDCSVVKGWVWDKSHPESGFTVELLDGSTVIASGASTINRPDLQSAGYGTGNYGFSISLPSSLKDGITHNISVRIKGVNYTLEGSPKSIMCPIPSQYRGGVDATGGWSCDAVKGWVWDQSYPNNTLTVELVEGGTVLASAVANAYRADVKAAGFGSGNSGFTIPIPASLKDGRAHQLSVRVKGSTVALSSQTLTCNSTARTGDKGYVYDPVYKTENKDQHIGLKVFPNPSLGNFFVHFSLERNKPARLSVVTVSGVEIWTKQIVGVGEEQKENIEVNWISSGEYFIVLKSGLNMETSRVIIVK